MSQASKVKRTRAQSAKFYDQRKRPLSGKSIIPAQKTQFIQKVYAQIPNLSQRPSVIRQKNKINSMHYGLNFMNQSNKSGVYQGLTEENIQLKKKIFALSEEIARMNNKLQTAKTKNLKFTKNLNVQFENQALWTGNNAYLVTGVKNQYQKLKIQYKQKCNELNKVKNEVNSTYILELKKEIQVLKKQNKFLIQQSIKQQSRNKAALTIQRKSTNHQQNLKMADIIISELETKCERLQNELQKTKRQSKQMQHMLRNEQAKIKFVQKLIIQKDNSLHTLNRRNKKLQKDKHQINDQLQAIKKINIQIQEQAENKLNLIRENQSKKRIDQRFVFDRTIHQRNAQIQKLQKEIAYLTTLMSYWKPLDQNKNQSEDNFKSKRTQILLKEQDQKRKKTFKNLQSLNSAKSFISRATSDLVVKNQQKQAIEPRQQKRADRKRSQLGEKCRNVKDNEIQQVCEILRYRMIYQRISANEITKLFNYQSNPDLSLQQNEWKSEYINQCQTQIILTSQPFILTSQQSHLLSRYIIQDFTADYIYSSPQNQNKRSIIKSIIKNIIGQYDLSKSMQQIKKLSEVQLAKYSSKIMTILEQMYPAGFVTKKKLLEIFVGSGFEIQHDVMEYIIGKLLMQTDNLATLKYNMLF